MRRPGVALPLPFENDGTPTAAIAPLRPPHGTSLVDILVGGWEFDGELGQAG
jgi:hypothetical protein